MQRPSYIDTLSLFAVKWWPFCAGASLKIGCQGCKTTSSCGTMTDSSTSEQSNISMHSVKGQTWNLESFEFNKLVYEWAIKYFNLIIITALHALVSFEIKWNNVRHLWLLEKTQEQNLPSSWVHVELGNSIIWEWCFDAL